MTSSTYDEVIARFDAYEKALMANDLVSLREFFTSEAHRFGPNSTQYGADEIDKARRAQIEPLKRKLKRTALQILDDMVGVATAEVERSATGQAGRQTQVWVKRLGTWRIAHAHVSMIPTGE